VLDNITDEIENLFDPKRVSDFSYQYVSTLNDEYTKRRGNWYISDIDEMWYENPR